MNMIKAELKKTLVDYKIVLLILLILVSHILLFGITPTKDKDYSMIIYRSYSEKLKGEYNDEKLQEIKKIYEEDIACIDHYADYTDKYFSGEMRPEDYSKYLNEYNKAVNELSTVKYTLEKLVYLDGSEGFDREIIFDTWLFDLFDRFRFEIPFLLFAVFFSVFVFDMEKRHGTEVLLKTSIRGGTKLVLSKLILVFGASFMMVFLSYGLEIVLELIKGHNTDWEKSAACIMGFGAYKNLSFAGLYLIEVLQRAFVWGTIAVSICMIYSVSKSVPASFLCSIGVIFIPQMLVRDRAYGNIRYCFMSIRLNGLFLDMNDCCVIFIVNGIKLALYSMVCVILWKRNGGLSSS